MTSRTFASLLLIALAASAASAHASELRTKIEGDEPVFGVFAGSRDADRAVEIDRRPSAAATDFVFFDLEREPWQPDLAQAFARALAGGAHGLPLAARIPPIGNDTQGAAGRIAELIDAGAEAIVVPHVRSAEQARLAVAETGERALNLLIVEDREGLEALDEIAAVPGIDVLFAGPGDFRRTFEGDMQQVEAAIQKVLGACRAQGLACGITAGAQDIPMRLFEGWRMVIVTEDAAIGAGRGAWTQIQRMREQTARDLVSERPIEAVDSVWIEDLTWMEVRDAQASGKRTAIVPTGGIEQNGPYLVTGKHNVVLEAACEQIARRLADALCAPVIKLVPEGTIDPPSGHMMFPGTLSLRPETFVAVIEDVARSLLATGFEQVFLIGDSGGNQRGLEAVAAQVDGAFFVPEFYRYPQLLRWMESELGVEQPIDEGLHDDFAITAMMLTVDPESVRLEQRRATGKASINGVPLEPLERTLEIGRKLIERRVEETVAAIRRSRAASSDLR